MPPTSTIPVGNNKEMQIVAIRPFRHQGNVLEIGKTTAMETGQAKHLIACGKALEATKEGLEKAAEAKKLAEERDAKIAASLAPARVGSITPADIKAITTAIKAEVAQALSDELDTKIEELQKGMDEAAKKAVEEALKNAKK